MIWLAIGVGLFSGIAICVWWIVSRARRPDSVSTRWLEEQQQAEGSENGWYSRRL